MKNKNISILIFLLLTASIFSACNKELNVFPSTSVVDGNVIVDTKSAATVLNGVYSRLAAVGVDNSQIPSVLWEVNNEAIPAQLSGSLKPLFGTKYARFNFTPTSGDGDGLWNHGYSIINAANGFLRNVDPVSTIPAATKKQMVAEAKFLRAFANSQLLLYFGQYYDVNSKYGVILRNEMVVPSNIGTARSSVGDTYTAILADIDAAIPDLLPVNTRITNANAAAAKLLKARVLINRAAAGDYAKVISLTNDIITNGPFTLEPNVKDIFLNKGLSSKEVILGIQPLPNQSIKTQDLVSSYYYLVTDSLKSQLKNDPRNQWMYQAIIDPFSGPASILTKYYSGDIFDLQPTTLSETSYVFRLTEAYLLQAEAIALSGGDISPAKTLLKTVLSRAGLSDFTAVNTAATGAELQVLVVKEVMKNFAAENGIDWFALRRLPMATIAKIRPNLVSQKQFIFPIPSAEILGNGKMIQNPEY